MTLTGSTRLLRGFGLAAPLYHMSLLMLGGGARDGLEGWLAFAVWGFFTVMLVLWPAKWALFVGIMLLAVVVVQSGSWWLAVWKGKAHANAVEFAASELPYLVSAVCCLRLWGLLRKARARAAGPLTNR